MNARVDRYRWFQGLLAAGVVVLALAPLPAFAHGGHDHGPAVQPAREDKAADTGQGRASPAHGWSQSCPAAPGSPCCCGDPKASLGSAKIALVNIAGWGAFIQPLVHVAPDSPRDAPRALLPPSLVLPRAPPLLS